MIPSFQVLNGEAMAAMSGLPDESVDCIVSSPPYWGLRDYGTKDQLGLERTPEEYVARIVKIFHEAKRILKKRGTFWLNLGDCYATGGGKVGVCPGGGKQGDRWRGGFADHSKGRGTPDRAGDGSPQKKTYLGPMQQPNRLPIPGLKAKDLVGIPWRVAFALQADDWYLRRDIIWHKPNVMPESVTDRPTTCHEYIFLFTKSEKYFYDAEAVAEPQDEHERTRRLKEQENGLQTEYTLRRDQAHGQVKPGRTGCARSVIARQNLALKGTRNRRSVWKIATSPYQGAHFATFPKEIPSICIRAGCPMGGVVLDPFAGSGTTGQVALELGRSAVLIELNPDYVKLIMERCNVTPGLALT